MAATINGFSLAYTATGAVVLWSGIRGETISATFRGLLSGKGPSPASDTEKISTAAAAAAAGTEPAGTDNANLETVGKFMAANGYSAAAAAGIAGCVAGESGGDPESSGGGGRGLIAWTPPSALPDSAFTGNATADLNAQLAQILAYNNAQGAGLIAMLNAQADPVAAADFYSQHFERPAVTDSDVRAGVAQSVYATLTAA